VFVSDTSAVRVTHKGNKRQRKNNSHLKSHHTPPMDNRQ